MTEAGSSARAADRDPVDGELVAPWAERRARGLGPAYRETFGLVALRPGDFFGRLRTDRPGAAVLFGLLSGSAGLFVASFYSFLSARHWWDFSRDLALELGPERAAVVQRVLPYLTAGFSLAEALTAPLKVAIGILAGAGVTHLVLVLLRAAPRGFATTLSVVGYGFGLCLLLALPVCGFPVVAVWLLAALVLGVSAAQRCRTWQAAVAVLTPGLTVVLFGLEPWLAGMFTLVRTVRAAAGAAP